MDSHLATPLLKLLGDDDARIRQKACEAVAANWDPIFAPQLTPLLRDSDNAVREAAFGCLRMHAADLNAQRVALRKMIEEDGPAASKAIAVLPTSQDVPMTREQLVRLFSSTNLPVVATAFSQLRYQNLTLNELAPLLASPLPHARLMGLNALASIGDKAAVDRFVASLQDPNEAIRWMVRSRLRLLTGQKIGADPAAWERWWAENKDTFTPQPAGRAGFRRN